MRSPQAGEGLASSSQEEGAALQPGETATETRDRGREGAQSVGEADGAVTESTPKVSKPQTAASTGYSKVWLSGQRVLNHTKTPKCH